MTIVAVVASEQQRPHPITLMLESGSAAGMVTTMEIEASKLFHLAEAPEIIIVNSIAAHGAGLEALERLSERHPNTSLVVVSNDQSPEFLLRAMRAGVCEVLSAPVANDQLQAALARIMQKRMPERSSHGKILAFLSCKGGSGVTFLATNLGYALAQGGKRIALLDLNLQFGDAALFVSDRKPASNLAEVAQQIHRLDAAFLSAAMMPVLPNFNILAAAEDPAHGNEVRPQHIEAILQLARQQYDFVVLDLGRSLDAVSLKALDMADIIFPVLQTTLPYIRDGKRLMNVLRSLEYGTDKVRLIVNRHEKKNEICVQDLERAFGMRIFRIIPNHHQAAAASVNQGIPVLKLAGNSPISRALRELAHDLADDLAPGEPSWISRLFNLKAGNLRAA